MRAGVVSSVYITVLRHSIIHTYIHTIITGMALRATSAYGVRLYRNGSSMVMHNDKVVLSHIPLNPNLP